MRITCPKCEFKGLIDSAPLAQETPVACVRCGTTFEAVLVEGEIQTKLLPEDNYETFFAPQSGSDLDAQPPDSEAEVEAEAVAEASEAYIDADDVLTLPQTPEVSYQSGEPELALEDVLLVSSADAEPATQEDAPDSEIEGATEEGAAAATSEAYDLESFDEALPEKTIEAANEPSFNFSHVHEESAADYDRQHMGTRLMRISPLWLLICGVAFVSVIILSNKFAKPAEQEQRVATNFAASSNKATNQTLSQPATPVAANPAASSVQDSSQMAAPAPVELKKDEKAVEEKAEKKTQEESKGSAVPAVAPEAETKSSAPVYQAQSSGDNAGGFTIQLGSYNVIEQANERVARLQAAGFDARVASVELPKRGTWYRVQAGRFGNREEAARYGNEMKSRGAADNFIIAETQGGK